MYDLPLAEKMKLYAEFYITYPGKFDCDTNMVDGACGMESSERICDTGSQAVTSKFDITAHP